MKASLTSPHPHVLTFQDLRLLASLPLQADVHENNAEYYDVAIAIDEYRFLVHFTNPEAAEWLRRRFHDMLTAETEASAQDVHVYARQDAQVSYFWIRNGRVWTFDAEALLPHVLAFFAECVMTVSYFDLRAGIGLHAAAVGIYDRVCAIVGHSTAGKTTTALACAAVGMSFFSDERCVLEAGKATPFLRSITVRAAGRALLLRDPDLQATELPALLNRLSDDHQENMLPPSRITSEPRADSARLRALVVLSGYGDQPFLERTDVYRVMPELLQSIVCKESALDRVARVISEMRQIPIFRMRLGPPGQSALAIQRLLAGIVQ